MPAGPPFVAPDLFQYVAHFIGAAGTEEWRSELTVHNTTVPTPADTIQDAIKQFFVTNLRSDCTLSHIDVREWTFGPQPIATRGILFSTPYSLAGEKPSVYGGQQAAPALTGKEVVAFCKLATTRGRPGKVFLRQLLDLGDIGAVAGSPWEFIPGGRVEPTSFHVQVVATIAPFFNAVSGPEIVVVHFSKKAYDANPISSNLPTHTPVLDMNLIRPSTNDPTRKNKL